MKFNSLLLLEQLKSKAYRDTISILKGSKYMYLNMTAGILGTLIRVGLPLNQNTIDNMKDAMIDYFYDGVEPEWYPSKAAEWFDDMSPEYFENNPKGGIKIKREFTPPNFEFQKNY